jgi:sialidase-1
MDGNLSTSDVAYVEIAAASAAHPRNDSASIVELDDGSLFMVWIEMHASAQGGHDEAPASISSMRSRDGGVSWGERTVEQSPLEGDHSVYNPSLIALPGGELLFFYLKYHHLVWNEPLVASGCLRRSGDGGKSWGDETRVWDHAGYGCANHTFTRLGDGRLLKSCDAVSVWGSYPHMTSRSGCFISDDDGRTWREPADLVQLPLRGTMENHIIETAQGHLLMCMRNQIGSVFLSRSADRGETWSKPQSSGLSSPESMPSLTRVPSTGDALLVWNNSEFDYTYDHSGKRTPLTCAVSTDGGESWMPRKHIEDDPEYEFSNVACSYTTAGKAIVTYFTSKMIDSAPPGKMGRAAMSLKGAIFDVDWLYR